MSTLPADLTKTCLHKSRQKSLLSSRPFPNISYENPLKNKEPARLGLRRSHALFAPNPPEPARSYRVGQAAPSCVSRLHPTGPVVPIPMRERIRVTKTIYHLYPQSNTTNFIILIIHAPLQQTIMESARASYDNDLHNLKATELRLGLPGTGDPRRANKRSLTEANESNSQSSEIEEAAPVAKAQLVGWPPLRSFRRNNFQTRKTEVEAAGLYVKVAMDGVPYLRKIDLKMCKGYKELTEAFEDIFKCFSLGDLLGNERRNGSEYTVTYEDRDGDWMLVGDVPWEMFISSCKRLRIMRGSEARGLNLSA